MNRHGERRAKDPEAPKDAPATPSSVPALAGSAAVGPVDAEGLGAALKLQAEILKRLHDQQAQIQATIQDTRRSEMMIQSTQALNDSFTGMRRVQEKLLDRLDDGPATRRGATWLLAFGILLVVAALLAAAHWIGERLRESATSVGASRDALATATFDALEERLLAIEGRDTAAAQAELTRLREIVGSMSNDAAKLKEERDRAREELGAVRATVAKLEGDLEAQRGRTATAEQEVTRLTERALNDQRVLSEMNRTLEALRESRIPVPPKPPAEVAEAAKPAPTPPAAAPVTAPPSPGTPAVPPAASPGANGSIDAELAAALAKAGIPLPAEAPATSVPPPPTPVAEAGREAAPSAPSERPKSEPVAQPFLDSLNQLLAKHRGSDVYTLTSAKGVDATGLTGVVLEVRGPDGALLKTVEAERATFALGAKDILELGFETGTVAFRQGLSRTVKSPFFNNRYQILLIGVDPAAWKAAALPFVASR